MIRQLRRKFVAINMVLVSVVLAVMFGVLLASTWQQQRQQTMRLLEQAVQQQPGDHPAKPSISRTQPGDVPAERNVRFHVVVLGADAERHHRRSRCRQPG